MVHPARSPVKGGWLRPLPGCFVWSGSEGGGPNDAHGGVESRRAVAPAVARAQTLTKATFGIVGRERMAARAVDKAIHACIVPDQDFPLTYPSVQKS